MRDIRNVPPHARVARIFERVLRFAGFALINLSLVMFLLASSGRSGDLIRLGIIGVLLSMLSFSGSVAVKLYSTHVRQSESTPYPSPSWQSQLRGIALAAILPICALILAVIIPVTSDAFAIIFPIGLIGGVTLLVTCAVVSARRSSMANDGLP
ncbi:MAG: hypothetical protein ACXWQR_21475 [Ktedonobacterales bacterium]